MESKHGYQNRSGSLRPRLIHSSNYFTKLIMKDFKLTLNQVNTDGVAFMALRAPNAKEAMNKAHRCMGQTWFTVTIEEAV